MTTPAAARQQQLFEQAKRLHAAGDIAGSLAACEALRKETPDHPQTLHLHGVLLLAQGRLAEARASLNRALERKPNDPLIVHDLAGVYRREDRYEDARRAIDRALSAHPTHPLLLSAKAEMAYTMGDFATGWDAIRSLAGDATPHGAMAIAYSKLCHRFGERVSGIEVLERALRDEKMPRAFRKEALFRLGDLCDGEGQYDRAFQAYHAANELKKQETRFDPAALKRRIDETMRVWTPELVASLRGMGEASRLPVFVLGMWRSGTTLIEQVLATHPRVHGAGELFDIGIHAQRLQGQADPVPLLTNAAALTKQAIAKASRDYTSELRRRGGMAERVTDKMPMNGLHLGLIGAMLPEASILHCERDPRDICLSCYFNLPGDRAGYSADLRHLGLFYREYTRLIRHWRSITPLRWLDVRYEEVVANLEAKSRETVAFIGLDWDSRCLAFDQNTRVARTASLDQVRRPIYATSIQRWKHYERHLAPLLEALAE